MAKEIERKYLVVDESWRSLQDEGERLTQAYVLIDQHGSARVRISGTKAKLALKFGAAALARDEFEYTIPVADAEDLLQQKVGGTIEKTRYRISYQGRIWEVDEFHAALSGLVIAEVELAATDEVPVLPAWVGADITGDAAYYNLSLAIHGKPVSI